MKHLATYRAEPEDSCIVCKAEYGHIRWLTAVLQQCNHDSELRFIQYISGLTEGGARTAKIADQCLVILPICPA